MPRFINQKGFYLIKRFEGLYLRAYKDEVGVWTIGYGHTGSDVKPNSIITSDEADNLLDVDLDKFCSAVNNFVKVPLNDDEFAALVSLVYNIGSEAFKTSTLLKKLNGNDYIGAANEFLKWTYAGKKQLPGLVNRRSAERDLFLGQQSKDSNSEDQPK